MKNRLQEARKQFYTAHRMYPAFYVVDKNQFDEYWNEIYSSRINSRIRGLKFMEGIVVTKAPPYSPDLTVYLSL